MADFQTQMLLPGVEGIDLKRPADVVAPTRAIALTNVIRDEEGAWQQRPGQTTVATAAGNAPIHSIGQLEASGLPSAGYPATRIWGVGQALKGNFSGVLTDVDTFNYSGHPLTMLAYRPPLSGTAWMFIGDTTKMRKVRGDLLDLPIGLPAPALQITSTLIDTADVLIDACEVTTGWVANAGTGGVPTFATIAGKSANALEMTTNVGAAPGQYYNFASKAYTLNLLFGGTTAGPDDQIHIWVKISNIATLSNLRLYFVCSSTFTTTTVPGESTTTNLDAYRVTFIPSEFSPGLEAWTEFGASGGSTVTAGASKSASALGLDTPSETPRQRLIRQVEEGKKDPSVLDHDPAPPQPPPNNEPDPPNPTPRSADAPKSYQVALPRSRFTRIGSASGRSWGTITGMVIVPTMNTNTAITVTVDDIRMQYGSGLDSSPAGNVPYDWRSINYDTRTGARSNPSPVQSASLDVTRRPVRLTPAANGDSALRQRFFRRGGSLIRDWYYVGENTLDGGEFIDSLADNTIQTQGLLEFDNDQPVTTVNDAGDAVFAQPLPAIWGPINDVILGCGDPYRKGHVYWCKRGEPDHWPRDFNAEVCAPDEELVMGCVYGGQSYVFSKKRGYGLLQIAGAANITPVPTRIVHGLVARKGLVVGYGGIYFVSHDGIYRTDGGSEENLTDESIRPIFFNQTVNGHLPIEFSDPDGIALEIHDNELWFLHTAVGGYKQVWIYSLLYQFWRFYSFAEPPYSLLSPGTRTDYKPDPIIIGSTITAFTNEGNSDNGNAVTCTIHTPALDQGFPRQNKVYGDAIMDVGLQGDEPAVTFYLTPVVNNLTTSLDTVSFSESALGPGTFTRKRKTLTPFRAGGVGAQANLARNCSLQIVWSTAQQRPKLHHVGLSFIPQPDNITNRPSDWSILGTMGEKLVKGVMLDCDTLGTTQNLDIQGDAAFKTSITVSATTGRQVVYKDFTPQFRARMVRLVPTSSAEWILYDHRWIFDGEPIVLTRWESQQTDNGVPGQQTPLYAYITLASTATVTLTVESRDQSDIPTTKTYSIASTAGAKSKKYVMFEAVRGVLFKYIFTSSAGFSLYREESSVEVMPWGADRSLPTKPFGTDDLDPARFVGDAEAITGRTSRFWREQGQ